MSEVADDRIFRGDEIERSRREEREAVCQWVRKTLAKKPNWADAFIAVRIDGTSMNDYAAAIDLKDASIVSKWLARSFVYLPGANDISHAHSHPSSKKVLI